MTSADTGGGRPDVMADLESRGVDTVLASQLVQYLRHTRNRFNQWAAMRAVEMGPQETSDWLRRFGYWDAVEPRPLHRLHG